MLQLVNKILFLLWESLGTRYKVMRNMKIHRYYSIGFGNRHTMRPSVGDGGHTELWLAKNITRTIKICETCMGSTPGLCCIDSITTLLMLK